MSSTSSAEPQRLPPISSMFSVSSGPPPALPVPPLPITPTLSSTQSYPSTNSSDSLPPSETSTTRPY
ncbi:hypothetical protein Tdes44962_MAKER08933 [Teratosphaeria destructans]|uniref:Uncharacterized protein n=1 Tax=Teratosphaeria destructans TaxID=418781 RepID=A0A9W7SV19_9PEZI|nr:hypothetical protein Tdes44962_MAKER08933 [Teratosphaeria destructans]